MEHTAEKRKFKNWVIAKVSTSLSSLYIVTGFPAMSPDQMV